MHHPKWYSISEFDIAVLLQLANKLLDGDTQAAEEHDKLLNSLMELDLPEPIVERPQ